MCAIHERNSSGPSSRSESATAPWRFARRWPSGPSTERDVGVGGLRQAEEAREQDLARRRVHEIRTPHDLAYALRGIVDHDGDLVSGRAVVTAHDEVVHDLLEAPQQTIVEAYANIFRTDPKRRRSSRGLAFRALGSRQPAAGAGISVRGGDAVRRRCRRPDLRPRAVTRVEQRGGIEPSNGLFVEFHPLRLAHDGTVPVEPDRTEIRELRLLYPRPYPRAVEVLHPHQKPRPCRARKQPR